MEIMAETKKMYAVLNHKRFPLVMIGSMYGSSVWLDKCEGGGYVTVTRGKHYGIVEEGLTPEDADKMIVERVKLALSLGNKKVIGTGGRVGLPLGVIMYAAAASTSCIMWKSKKCL